ncbi:MAG: hypothetical protein P1U85_20740 [Verrucomicrobiales bacterium]|nr:hypothetical protein [Verrucomicrobiales bacterium]
MVDQSERVLILGVLHDGAGVVLADDGAICVPIEVFFLPTVGDVQNPTTLALQITIILDSHALKLPEE